MSCASTPQNKEEKNINSKLQAPFPYFGGKSTVAGIVWAALGDVKHYMEPCFGSGAVLLQRPYYDPSRHIETVNDKDGFVCNVWRAIKHSPEETAEWCDWPVNHADLSARKRKLLVEKENILQNLMVDDEWHDPKLAGYWIWAASCWIGSGLTCIGQRPHLTDGGMGVHKIGQIPHLGNVGKGVHKIGQRPKLYCGGVHRMSARIGQRPHLSSGWGAGGGVHKTSARGNIYAWFEALSARLRHVRVTCGDWSLICGGNWQDKMGTVGIFFDPPYGVDDRDEVYDVDSKDVAHDIRRWAIERGRLSTYRIVIAGYEEHMDELSAYGWGYHKWKAGGGYSHIKRGKTSRGEKNKVREVIYFSPHCENPRLF